MTLGEQGWCSGESTRLPPMWPRFDSRTRRHKWVKFVLVLFSSSRIFLWVLRFPPPRQKPAYSRFQLAVSCAPRSHMDRIAAARGAIVCFRFDLVELHRCCTLRWRLAETIINIIIKTKRIKNHSWQNDCTLSNQSCRCTDVKPRSAFD